MAASLESAISETKDVLQPLFVKPKMSTKLLSKPPFRFIHDIIIATLKATGFPNGFFSLDELDSSKFKDSKSAKVSFLNKLIHLINVGNGIALEVSSSKVVAGLEPLQTNSLLSTFGRLAQDQKVDRKALIQHCEEGESPAQSDNKSITSENVIEQNEPIDQNSIMEQIKACDEDMEHTRAMISGLVAKPKCSDKLLAKPPFRFIHDLIMAIGKATQFDLSLYFCRLQSDCELISSNVKEKQSKLHFLEKLVNFLEGKLEMTIDVKPAKIISGLEPERTRYLLQIFTVAASTKRLAPTESVEAKYQEPPKNEPQNEEAKVNEKENVSHNDKCPRKSFDDSVAQSAESEVQTVVEEEAPTKTSPPTEERPETARGRISADIKERNNGPIKAVDVIRPSTAIVEHDDGDVFEGVSRDGTQSEEAKTDGMSIFQKIIQEQKAREDSSRILHSPHSHEGDAASGSGTAFQLDSIILPTQMSEHDFQSLADAIQCITQSAAPLDEYINGVHDDMKTIMNERKYWIAEQKGMEDAWKRHKHGAKHLEPLKAKLNSLESQVGRQVTHIKRLEESVRKNDKILNHGVTHAY